MAALDSIGPSTVSMPYRKVSSRRSPMADAVHLSLDEDRAHRQFVADRRPAFTGVDVFWAQAGHDLFGGCKERR
jgi:hypothetical protein